MSLSRADDTTVILRRRSPGEARDIDDDLADEFSRGFNAAIDLASSPVKHDGDPRLAALIRRQRKA